LFAVTIFQTLRDFGQKGPASISLTAWHVPLQREKHHTQPTVTRPFVKA